MYAFTYFLYHPNIFKYIIYNYRMTVSENNKKRMPRNVRKKKINQQKAQRRRSRQFLKKFIKTEQIMIVEVEHEVQKELRRYT